MPGGNRASTSLQASFGLPLRPPSPPLLVLLPDTGSHRAAAPACRGSHPHTSYATVRERVSMHALSFRLHSCVHFHEGVLY